MSRIQGGSQPARSSIDPARRLAYNVLHQVGAEGGYANLVLSESLREQDTDARDAAFTTELVNGVIRSQGFLDAVIGKAAKRPVDKLDPRVLDILRLGAYQVLITNTDDYAAVNTSVELAKDVCGPQPVSFVNAVLRNVSRTPITAWQESVASDAATDTERLAVLYSQPTWIIEALADALGSDRGELEELLAAYNERPAVTLSARPGLSDVAELIAAGATPGRWSPLAAVAPQGSPGDVAAIAQGRAAVQDEGSQLVALALTNASVETLDDLWLDLCAGPGGKFSLLASVAAARGDVTVLGVEMHFHRARLMKRAIRRSGTGDIVVADATALPLRREASRVLVDAPCSGLGVLHRRPEIRWRRQPNDVADLVALQKRLLNSAIDAVAPGGVVGYATCSPHIAETELIVRSVVRRRTDIEIEDSRPLFPEVANLGSGPNVRLWPHRHGTDGMFFSLMRKPADCD